MPADAAAAPGGVLVIDAGTSALRALVVDAHGNAERIGVEPWRMFRPPDGTEYARELDGAEVDAAFHRLLEAAARDGASYAAIAFTGQREGVVFADEHGQAVLASPNIDARAAAEGMAIDRQRGVEVYDSTGHLPSLLLAPAKLEWMRAQRPGVADCVSRVLPLADWLASRLSGDLTISRSLACEVGLLNVISREVLPGALPFATPDVLDDGHEAGLWTRGDFVPIVLAGADTQCGALGAGAAREGDAACVAGWSAPVQLVLDQPLLDPKRRTWTGLHVLDRLWMLESNAGDVGRAWEWICGMLGVTAAEADAPAAQSPPGAHDGLMVLGRAPMNAAQMTAGVGAITFPLPLAMWSLDRADLLRATLEAAASAIRANVEQLEEVSERRIERLRLAGGMSRSALFAQILADVVNRPIEVARSPETTAVGAAMLAFVATGAYASIDEAVAVMTEPRKVVTPDLRTSATYDDCYARWRMLAEHMEQAP